MTKHMTPKRNPSLFTALFCMATLVMLAFPTLAVAQTALSFSKSFSPDTIGPGSVSTLTFTIVNNVSTYATELTFTDDLPPGTTIATPANASTDCTAATLSAPDGGTTITFSGGVISSAGICTVSVDVTSSTGGTHTNTSGVLTSSLGSSSSAYADLTVATDRPGFSKSFSPSSVSFGGRSTLTFTIDNAANNGDAINLNFTDNLPPGMVIAGPSNVVNTCDDGIYTGGILTAVPGTGVISLSGFSFAGASVGSGSSCTIEVDVIGNAVGDLNNVSGELTSGSSSPISSGKASAALEVTASDIALRKSFSDDPVPPGYPVTLEFIIDNFDRLDSATGIAFSDDLDATLTGLTFDSLLTNDCGGSVTGVGTTDIDLTGGTLPPEGFCTISASLSVPAGAASGVYNNTTDAITATIGGSPVTGNEATELLFVEPVPLLTKEFIDDPAGTGSDVTLEFTITNTDPDWTLNDITFEDIFDIILPTSPSGAPAPGFCGPGSTATFTPLINPPSPSGTTPARLIVTGASLAAAGSLGDSCTFSITLDVSPGAAAGTYTNITSDITGMIDTCGDNCYEPITGLPASDDLVVIAAPSLSKVFTDDPAQPGGTVTLEFTLSHDALAGGDATGITFTDNLAATFAGLTATLPPVPDPPCGSGSSLTASAGDTLLTFAGGVLTPGDTCTFSVTLDVPDPAAAGNYTNTTSNVEATVLGVATTGSAASDDLTIAGLVFTKEFIDDPLLPGDTVTLRFTLENKHPTDDATDMSFTDSLSNVLPGTPDLIVSGTLPTTPCGTGSSIIGTNSLAFTGGELIAGTLCSFDVTLQVPAAAADGTFRNTTSGLQATIGGNTVVFDPATDTLVIDSNLLALTKEFTDDPVIPGGTVTLEFTLTNLDPENAASAIAFTDALPAGLSATGFAPTPPCGTGSTLTGTTTLTFVGGDLPAGGSCTFSAALAVPAGTAPNIYTNQSSSLTGTINDLAVTGGPAFDDLVVNSVTLTKAFDGPSTTPGTATMTFSIENLSATNSVDDLRLTDDLDAFIPGLLATNLPLADVCGLGSLLTGTGFLVLTGGNLGPNGSCSFDVELQVPAGVTLGDYTNTTSALTRIGLVMGAAASDDLTILGTVGGTVSGLAGSGLVLRNNGGDDLAIGTNGAFTFSAPLADGSSYAVTVPTQPTGPSQTCTVANDSGTLAGANITNVDVTCTTDTFSVGGTVSGLAGSGLVLQNNAGDDLSIGADGGFTFSIPLADGSSYAVSVLSQPTGPSQTCSVANGSGTLASANVSAVWIRCTTTITQPIPTLSRIGLLAMVLMIFTFGLWRFRRFNASL